MFNIVVLFKKNIRIKTIHIHIHIHIHFTNQNTHIHIYMLQKNHTYIHTFYITIKSVKKKEKKKKKSDFVRQISSPSRRGVSQRRATSGVAASNGSPLEVPPRTARANSSTAPCALRTKKHYSLH